MNRTATGDTPKEGRVEGERDLIIRALDRFGLRRVIKKRSTMEKSSRCSQFSSFFGRTVASVGRVEYNEVRRNRPTEFDAVPCVLAHKCYRDAAEAGCFASSVIAGRVGRLSVFSANSPRSGDILYSNCVVNCRTQRARVAKKWLSI